MSLRKNRIQVFEHGRLYIGNMYGDILFEEKHLIALAKLNQLHNNEYFTLLHKGIRFSQYVGVIQIDGLVIEILPKIDGGSNDESIWQKVLIKMLKDTKRLKVNKVGQAQVNKQQIHLLDIYFEWFLSEMQLLKRQGLIKQYRTNKENVKVLKGKLEFATHINKNLIHKERFYTGHQVYDYDHQIHQILWRALEIISQFSAGTYLYSKCKRVQAEFPDVSHIFVNANTFRRLISARKTKPYETALEIARLIILNFAPNISSGKEKMLALLFDMNNLWEEFVLTKLKSAQMEGFTVRGQDSKLFWNGIKIRPDIVLKKKDATYVIDTKWKNVGNNKISTNDLRQMYVYNRYWSSFRALLLYPSLITEKPNFISFKNEKQECGIGKLNILEDGNLKDDCGQEIINWFN